MLLIEALAKGPHGYRHDTKARTVVLACSMDKFIIETESDIHYANASERSRLVDGFDDWRHEHRPTRHPEGNNLCAATERKG